MRPITVTVVGAVSSPGIPLDYKQAPFEVSVGVKILSGVVNYTLEYSYDDPFVAGGVVNWFPYPTMAAQTAALDVLVNGGPVTALRLTNAGTGTIQGRIIQSGP